MKNPKIEAVFKAVEKVFAVTRDQLVGPRRQRNVAEARMTAGYFLMTEAGVEAEQVPTLLARSRTWASFILYRCPEVGGMDKRYCAKVHEVYRQLKAA